METPIGKAPEGPENFARALFQASAPSGVISARSMACIRPASVSPVASASRLPDAPTGFLDRLVVFMA